MLTTIWLGDLISHTARKERIKLFDLIIWFVVEALKGGFHDESLRKVAFVDYLWVVLMILCNIFNLSCSI